MKAFSTIPFLRIMIPFAAGILAAVYLQLPRIPLTWLFLLLGALVALHFFRNRARAYKISVMLVADAFFFLYGGSLVYEKNVYNSPDYYGQRATTDSAVTWVGIVSDVPVQKSRSLKCELEVLQVHRGGNTWQTHGKIYAYFKQPVMFSPEPGNTMVITSRLMPIPGPKNPFEFDYRQYLRNRQVFFTTFIEPGSYALVNAEGPLNPVWKLGLLCKKIILSKLESSGLGENAYGICAALLTGYDDDIDRPVMQAFSHSGTLHVLSVSGLHTGLIYLLLNYLFNFFDKRKKHKLARLLFITVCLWFFALLTGFSAPVLRAVIMFNLLGVGRVYFRSDYRNQMNILLISAFILLCYNPYFITDVGFLLSYFAMFGLIYFQPALAGIWIPGNNAVNYIWQSVTASAAATLSTLPITLFCFKQFPLWFMICNLVVVPATFVILLLAVLVVFHIGWATWLVNMVVQFVIWFIALFDVAGTGYIEGIDFSVTDAMLLSLALLFFSAAIQYRSFNLLRVCLVAVIAWQLISITASMESKSASVFTVYHTTKGRTISLKNGPAVMLATADSSSYDFSVRPHLISFNNPVINALPFNFFRAKDVCALSLDCPGTWPAVDLRGVSLLVLSNNFRPGGEDIQKLPQLKVVVADGTNNNATIKHLAGLSRKFGFTLHNTRNSGAFTLKLQ